MNIPKIALDPESYWNQYQALAALIARVLTLADGGQLVTRGTDIMSPALREQAKLTVAEFENFGRAFATVATSLKENLNLETGGLAKSA